MQAAIEGSKQIFFTATSITLVIVSVFLPLTLTGGVIGGILKEFSMPLIVSTITSLLVSFSLTPLLLSKFGKLENSNAENFSGKFAKIFESLFDEIKNGYEFILRWGLNNRKKIYVGVIVLFVVSISLIGLGFIGSAFIPDTDQSEFVVDLEMAPQISFYENNLITKSIEKILLSKPEVIKVMAKVGLSSSSASTSSRNNITN